MRNPIRTPALLALLALVLAASSARAQALTVVSSDDHGLTLRLDLPAWQLVTDPVTHRSHVVAAGLQGRDEPGRPQVPAASALIALPDGARVSAAVIAEGDAETREHVTLAITGKPGWTRDPSLGVQPTVEDVPAILDGPWPRATLEVGEPFVVRRQRMAVVTVSPFQYDEATGRLTAKHSVTVRVTFAGGTGKSLTSPLVETATSDPVLEQSLVNPIQGRRFRLGLTPARVADLAFRSRTGAQGVAAFDEDQPEVRVKVDTTGAQAYLEDDLEANGFPAGVPIADVSVHRHEYVPGQTPPYVTIELPCEVVDANANGVFDSGDAVFVYAQSWAQRARATVPQRVWGDAEVVYVTRLTSRPGLRMATRTGWRGATGLTPLASYPTRRHYETQDGDPTSFYGAPPDTVTDTILWTSLIFYYNRPDTITFTATDLDTAHAASLLYQVIGKRTEGRVTYAAVRNRLGQLTTITDSAFWAGKVTATFANTVHGSALTEGVNALRLWGRRSDLAPDPGNDTPINTGLDWFEVAYWRAFRGIRGYLPCNSADGASVYQIKANGFASNAIEVWDVTDSTAAVRLQLDGSHLTQSAGLWSIEFQDSTGAGQPRQYVVFDTPRIADASAYSPVTRRNLTQNASPHDYLLVVPAAWESAVAPLVAARRAQGLDVLVAPYEAIKDEFNGGRPSAYAVKRLVQYAYANWGTRYVALMGDAGGPNASGLYPNGSQEWIPTMMILSPIGADIGGEFALELVPSDDWFGWCVDARCTDPSLAPKLHDVFVGRLPVSSAAEAAAVSAKLAAYDQVSVDQTWRHDMTLLADDIYSGTLDGLATNSDYCKRPYEAVFSLLSHEAQDIILNEAGLTQSNAEVFDMATWLANEPVILAASGDSCRPSPAATQSRTRAAVTPQLLSRLNAGKLWWNYQGHANSLLLAHEWIYYIQGSGEDWRALANTGKPFLFSAFSCHANSFTFQREHDLAYGQSIGETMLLVPSRGAIASWASTGYELIPSNDPTADHISLELARALFSQVPPDTSAQLRRAGDPFAHPVLGDAIALALMKWFKAPGGNAYSRQEGITYELLGDPATRLSVGQPQSSVVANGSPVIAGQAVRLHTPGDTLTLVADMVSNTALTRLQVDRTVAGVRDTLPASAYTVSPTFPDTASGGLGGRRYHIAYHASLTPQSYDFTFRSVDRQGLAASFDVALPLQTVLRADNTPVNDGDVLSPGVNLTMLVLSPAPIADPAHQLVVRVNGVAQAFSGPPVANSGDTSGREWVLAWTHDPLPVGDYAVTLEVNGAAQTPHTFKVTITSTELHVTNAMLFPNPFEDDLGAYFSFNLESGKAADVLIRVYTVTGRLVYRRFERQLAPGYHQLPWDGRDAEGDKLANGVYFYRLQASNGSSDVTLDGRIVKLRKPNREVVVTP